MVRMALADFTSLFFLIDVRIDLATYDVFSDNLRNHYPDCAKRGDQKIPETSQRGRRRHACQLASLIFLTIYMALMIFV